jgi:hypothetical protein
VITHHELRMLHELRAGGIRTAALFPADTRQPVNRTLTDWRGLVADGFPFVKVQLLRDNPHRADIGDWRGFLTRHGYDPALVHAQLGQDVPRGSGGQN